MTLKIETTEYQMPYLVHKRTSGIVFPTNNIYFSNKTPKIYLLVTPRISYHIILGNTYNFC